MLSCVTVSSGAASLGGMCLQQAYCGTLRGRRRLFCLVWSLGWDLVLVYRLSWGPAEERYIKDVTFIAIDAAEMDISEEVLFSTFLSVLAQAAGCNAMHAVGAAAVMATCLLKAPHDNSLDMSFSK